MKITSSSKILKHLVYRYPNLYVGQHSIFMEEVWINDYDFAYNIVVIDQVFDWGIVWKRLTVDTHYLGWGWKIWALGVKFNTRDFWKWWFEIIWWV